MSETTEIVFVPGSAVPSRELLAVWNRFQWSGFMVETVGPDDVPGWVCSPSPFQYVPDEWDWREDPRGFHVGTRI